MAKNTKEKSKKKVSNIMLVIICAMIIIYTAADFALQYFTTIEVSPTLTTAWFAFWGTELVALAAIKTTKVKHNKDEESTPVEPDTADPYEDENMK